MPAAGAGGVPGGGCGCGGSSSSRLAAAASAPLLLRHSRVHHPRTFSRHGTAVQLSSEAAARKYKQRRAAARARGTALPPPPPPRMAQRGGWAVASGREPTPPAGVSMRSKGAVAYSTQDVRAAPSGFRQAVRRCHQVGGRLSAASIPTQTSTQAALEAVVELAERATVPEFSMLLPDQYHAARMLMREHRMIEAEDRARDGFENALATPAAAGGGGAAAGGIFGGAGSSCCSSLQGSRSHTPHSRSHTPLVPFAAGSGSLPTSAGLQQARPFWSRMCNSGSIGGMQRPPFFEPPPVSPPPPPEAATPSSADALHKAMASMVRGASPYSYSCTSPMAHPQQPPRGASPSNFHRTTPSTATDAAAPTGGFGEGGDQAEEAGSLAPPRSRAQSAEGGSRPLSTAGIISGTGGGVCAIAGAVGAREPPPPTTGLPPRRALLPVPGEGTHADAAAAGARGDGTPRSSGGGCRHIELLTVEAQSVRRPQPVQPLDRPLSPDAPPSRPLSPSRPAPVEALSAVEGPPEPPPPTPPQSRPPSRHIRAAELPVQPAFRTPALRADAAVRIASAIIEPLKDQQVPLLRDAPPLSLAAMRTSSSSLALRGPTAPSIPRRATTPIMIMTSGGPHPPMLPQPGRHSISAASRM